MFRPFFVVLPAAANPLEPRLPHFAPRAKQVIFLFMHGGPTPRNPALKDWARLDKARKRASGRASSLGRHFFTAPQRAVFLFELRPSPDQREDTPLTQGARIGGSSPGQSRFSGEDTHKSKRAAVELSYSDMDRRKFLSAAMAAPALLKGAAKPPVRIGFLGASHSHARGKIEIVRNSPDFDLVGIYEPYALYATAHAKNGLPLADSAESLLGDPSVEVIAVESDVRNHFRLAKMALEARKHVHLEKPPALDVESFRELQNLAARNELVFQMGYMWRHNPGLNRMIEAAREGWLGDVFLVQATIHKTLKPEDRPAWAEFRGGQMFELGPHVIDPLIRLLGRPDRVTPFLKKHGDYPDNMLDNTVAVFEFQSAMGVVVGSALSAVGSRHRSFEVHGTNGVATLRPIEPPTLDFNLQAAAGPYAAGRHPIKLPKYQRYVDDMKELAAAARGERPLGVNFREDLIVQEAVIAASGM